MTFGRVGEQPPPSARWSPERAAGEPWRSVGAQILVVDPLRDNELSPRLRDQGVSLTWCESAVDALIEFGRIDPDAVIVAPTPDGLGAVELVTALRQHEARLLLVALDAEAADAAGQLFLAGAAAAVNRPYDATEIMARLVAHTDDLDARARITFGAIELDPRAYEVRLAGCPVGGLPLKEFELLRVLMVHGNHVVPTDVIREALWGNIEDAPSSNAVAVHAARLRNRLEGIARVTRVRGRGYRLSLE